MRAFHDTVNAADGYSARKVAIAFAKTVATHGFYIPIGPYNEAAANLAHQKGWIYQVNIDGATGYKANLSVAELKALDV